MIILILKQADSLELRAYVENIPPYWEHLKVLMYHAYREDCNMLGASINIYVCSME